MPRMMTPADFCQPRIPVCDNWLDAIPADISDYIIELSSVPSTKTIARMVYDETMSSIDDELEVYDLTFTEGDEEDIDYINNRVFNYHTWDASVEQVYNIVCSSIETILLRLSLRQTDNMFNYYFKNYDDARRYIKKNKYAICDYLYDTSYDYDVYKEEDDDIEYQALRYMMMISFHQHYKCVLDKENKIPDVGGDEGDYVLRTTFVELDDGESPYDGTEYFENLRKKYS